MSQPTAVKPDIVVYDRDEAPVMFAEVKGGAALSDDDVAEIGKRFAPSNGMPGVRWLLLVDRERIRILCWEKGSWRTAEVLLSPDVFRAYDTDFSKQDVSGDYLGVLTEAWLRDIAYHWKSQDPPSFGVFKRLRVAELVAEGTTSTRPLSPLGTGAGDPVRRD